MFQQLKVKNITFVVDFHNNRNFNVNTKGLQNINNESISFEISDSAINSAYENDCDVFCFCSEPHANGLY